jgi:probable phosphoglycerate mutase
VLYFARHGESTANLTRTFANRTSGFPLTALGREQADALADAFSSLGITRLFASPLTRAAETAAVVSGRLGLAAVTSEALREFDVGHWEGSADQGGWTEYASVVQRWAAGDRACRISTGESCDDIAVRFGPFGNSLLKLALAGENVLCIGHGGTYRAALPTLLANVTHAFAAAQPFPNTAWVAAEVRYQGLWCTDWCGARP